MCVCVCVCVCVFMYECVCVCVHLYGICICMGLSTLCTPLYASILSAPYFAASHFAPYTCVLTLIAPLHLRHTLCAPIPGAPRFCDTYKFCYKITSKYRPTIKAYITLIIC